MKMRLPLFLLASSSAYAGNVLVVGPLPTQIAEIQAAVDAAIDGDVILVKSGTYATFSVPNKSVTITADAGQAVNVDGAIRVRNLAAGRAVVVTGLHAAGRAGTGNVAVGNGFFATNCAGSIRVQDCRLDGYDNDPPVACPAVPQHGAELDHCADVAFVRCTLTGSSGLPRLASNPGSTPDSQEGHGLVATGSSVSVYDSTIHGGQGGFLCNAYGDGTDGGEGAELSTSFLFASATEIAGGNGADSYSLDAYAGWGGQGLEILDAASQAHLLQCALIGGAGGTNQSCGGCHLCGFCGLCCDGNSGSPSVEHGGTLDLLSATARVLVANGVARESTQHALTVTGPPGDVCAVGIRRATDFVWTPARFGVQLLSPPPVRFMLLGTIPANGVLTTSIGMPSVPGTDPGQTYHLQLITSGSTPAPHLGTPLSIAVLDDAY